VALNDVFNGSIKKEIKEEDSSSSSFDCSFQTVGSEISRVKMEEDNTSMSDDADQKIGTENSNAWKKLMNLLMQLRKVCNQYPPREILSGMAF
jgi:hypothetical protein